MKGVILGIYANRKMNFHQLAKIGKTFVTAKRDFSAFHTSSVKADRCIYLTLAFKHARMALQLSLIPRVGIRISSYQKAAVCASMSTHMAKFAHHRYESFFRFIVRNFSGHAEIRR